MHDLPHQAIGWWHGLAHATSYSGFTLPRASLTRGWLFMFTVYLLARLLIARAVRGSLSALARRLFFRRWLYQEHSGEWHPVVGEGEHGPVIDVTGWRTRYARDVQTTVERRKRLFAYATVLLICITLLAEYFVDHGALLIAIFGDGVVLGTASIFIILMCLVGVFAAAFALIGEGLKEGLYRTGWQRMDGAKTIDPPPQPKPGPEKVAKQKGHGDAKPAPPHNIGRVFSGKRDGEPKTRFRS